MTCGTVYVSSKLKHRTMWLALQLPMVSTWIHSEELPPSECSAMWDRYREEIRACDAFLLYAEQDDQLKGCLIEMGMAFALERPILIVWEGGMDALAAKVGTIAHHESVMVLPTMEQAMEVLGRLGRTTTAG